MLLIFGIVFFSYLILCRYLRFSRIKTLLNKYNNVELNYRNAQDILESNATYDMPFISTISLSFALFRTYGIPTISKLLASTNQLADINVAGRRAEDTGVLLGECLHHRLDSDRGRMGLARINYLHGLYRNRISNDDFLYTLSLFVFEPIRWISKYEWRPLNSIEQQAVFLYYQEFGIRMGIENIPSTLIDLENWANDYEIKHMVYSKDNEICGEATLALMINQYPKFMQSFVRKASLALVDERLRLAMGFEKAPAWMHQLVKLMFNIRAFAIRHLALPRLYPKDFGQGPKTCPLNQYGRYQRTGYVFEPWYVKETWWEKLFPFPPDKLGLNYRRNGFKVEELGPEKFCGKGRETMEKDAENMKKRAI